MWCYLMSDRSLTCVYSQWFIAHWINCIYRGGQHTHTLTNVMMWKGETQVCERRAESGERGAEFGERRAEIFGLNFDRKWMYYRGFRVYY
jgi:hypothetical protein